MKIRVGDKVRIERDEIRRPSGGTWSQFRGRIGTVVEISRDRNYPHLTEFGIVFNNPRLRVDRPGLYDSSGPVTWFKIYEIVAVGSERDAKTRRSASAIGTTGEGRDEP